MKIATFTEFYFEGFSRDLDALDHCWGRGAQARYEPWLLIITILHYQFSIALITNTKIIGFAGIQSAYTEQVL